MHMADALVSPIVGGAFWALSGAVGIYCARQVRGQIDEGRLPLMGVAGAFVFAAQMINFTIPGTGSSGHIGGGLLLAALLGPHAAFLAIASVLAIQALFFADGGLLALGCNISNLGVFPAFVAYPLVYRPLAGSAPSRRRLTAAAIVGAIAGLQAGAFAVVAQTVLSGISQLPFSTFLLLMQPIHLAIGLVEGLATAAVLLYVREVRPEVLAPAPQVSGQVPGRSIRPVLAGLLVATVVVGGALSWFASTRPDGLEWSIGRVAGTQELEAPSQGVHGWLAGVQRAVAVLPDYALRAPEVAGESGEPRWPAPDAGTSVSGLVGSVVTLALVVAVMLVVRRRKQPSGS